MATDAANYLCHQLQHLLAPISSVTSQSGPWEERSAMVGLTQKLQKYKRNKRWRQMRRKHVAELFQKVPFTIVSSFFVVYYTFLNALPPSGQKFNNVKCDDISCLVSQERADYDRIDQEADEWRAKQIAKDIAKRKVLSRIS